MGIGSVFLSDILDKQRAVFKGIWKKKLTDTGFSFWFFVELDFYKNLPDDGFLWISGFWIDIAINQLLPQKQYGWVCPARAELPFISLMVFTMGVVNHRGKQIVDIRNKKGWIEILPRFKIQYPMKNQDKDEAKNVIKKAQNYLKKEPWQKPKPVIIRTL